MNRLTYKYLVSQIANGVFHLAHQMPNNPDSAHAVYKKYCELCNIPPRKDPELYFGCFIGDDVWFIHPRNCPRGLLLLARRHLSANYRFAKTGPNTELRSVIYNALGFRRPRTTPVCDRLLIPIAKRAKEIPLVPQTSGLYSFKRAMGIEIEGTSPLSRDELNEALPYWTNVVEDRSIRVIHAYHQAAEVRMLMNRAGFDHRIHTICKRLSAVGFTTNRSCGLHVHMDARHLSWDVRQRMQKTMTAWLKLLVELVPESRRNSTYCKLDTKSGRYCAVSIETGGKTPSRCDSTPPQSTRTKSRCGFASSSSLQYYQHPRAN
jgi:hypothetical protein